MIIFKKFQQIKEIYNTEFSGDVQFFCFSPEIILLDNFGPKNPNC